MRKNFFFLHNIFLGCREMSLKIFVLWFFFKILFFSSSTSCWPVTETKITAVVGSRRDIERDSMTRDDGVRKNEVDVNKPPTDETPPPTVTAPTEEFKKDLKNDEDWMLMGDQPMNDDGFKTISVAPLDDDAGAKKVKKNFGVESSTIDPITKRRMIHDRDQRLSEIKTLIPFMIGRGNMTEANIENNSSLRTFDNIISSPIEKLILFPPNCSVPKIAKDNWKDDNLLYLFFNVTYGVNATLANAIIRLHRISNDNFNNQNINNNSGEEIGEKLLRVSIYWFSKQGKKQKIKKRLCDSKVITEKQSTVELNVKPALISWLDTQNLGFAVKVENQEEIVLKATNFFKGADCKSNLAHFPSFFLNGTLNEFHVKPLENNFLIMDIYGYSPIISICTVESTIGALLPDKFVNCQLLKKLYNQTESESNHRKVQNLMGTDHHRIRHQKHNIEKNQLDIRNLMENETIYLTKDQFDSYRRANTR